MLADHRAIGDAPAVDEDHLIARLEPVHRYSDAAHRAACLHANFPPKRGTLVRQSRKQSQRHHDIAKVERRGGDIDFHMVRPQGRRVAGLHPQAADLPRVGQEQPVRRILAGWDARVFIAIAQYARHPQLTIAHSQFAFSQVITREPRESFEILGGAQIDEAKIEPGLFADLDRHAARRPPERAPARILRVESRLACHDGDAAPAMGLIDPAGNQRLNQGDEFRNRPLAGRILWIPVAEKIDRLHVRGIRVLIRHEWIFRQKGIEGDCMDLRMVELGYPRPSQAGGLANHPARNRKRRPVRLGHVLRRRLQQCRATAGSKRGPARAGFNRRAFCMGNERQAARNRCLPPEPPIVRRERNLIRMEEQDFRCVSAQQARFERGRLP